MGKIVLLWTNQRITDENILWKRVATVCDKLCKVFYDRGTEALRIIVRSRQVRSRSRDSLENQLSYIFLWGLNYCSYWSNVFRQPADREEGKQTDIRVKAWYLIRSSGFQEYLDCCLPCLISRELEIECGRGKKQRTNERGTRGIKENRNKREEPSDRVQGPTKNRAIGRSEKGRRFVGREQWIRGCNARFKVRVRRLSRLASRRPTIRPTFPCDHRALFAF